MAITHVDYLLWVGLRLAGMLPEKPAVLELGESNWYGDVPVAVLLRDLPRLAAADEVDMLHQAVTRLMEEKPPNYLFGLAKAFWRAVTHLEHYDAIDLGGTSSARKLDLNHPVELPRRYHLVINTGTAERIFNQMQFFRTVHDACLPGGLMAHTLPLRGWFDHGFYNYHPTFLLDLAHANGYHTVAWTISSLEPRWLEQVQDARTLSKLLEEAPANLLHHVLWRKQVDQPFQMPFQGYYAGRLDEEGQRAWRENR